MPRPIEASEIAYWLDDGYVLVEDFLSADELGAVSADVDEYLPQWHALEHSDGGFRASDFPFTGRALTSVPVCAQVLDFVEAALDGAQPFMSYCALWGKYANRGADFEQQLHQDYPNNTLVYPRADGKFREIPFILYLTDVDEDLGPTWIVSQKSSDPEGRGLIPTNLSPQTRGAALQAQTPLTAKAGSLLIYSLQTFHRGSAFKATEGQRFTLHFGYKSTSAIWSGHGRGWAFRAMSDEMHDFLTRATPAQRGVLGFPMPGDDYWNEATLRAVAARYPEMDMAPYAEATVTRQ